MSRWHEKRKQQNHKVLPGFPRQDKLQAREEIEAYFDGDKIQCLLCGRWLKELGNHLRRIHDISPDEYKVRYGLPFSKGLGGESSKAKRREMAYKKMQEGRVPYVTEGSLRPKGKYHRKHPDQPFDRERKAQQALKIHNQARKWEKEDYEAVLVQMQRQQRTLTDVCKDEDRPSIVCWNRYCHAHPELKLMERAQAINNILPYSVQARTRKFSMSSQFRQDCQALHQKGLTYEQIGSQLGVSSTAVRLALVGDKRKNGRKK